MDKFIPAVCEHCNQTTEYKLALDGGSAWIVIAIANAVRNKGQNRVKLSDIEVLQSQWPDVAKRSFAGYMTGTQAGNASRPRYHGLIALIDDEPNTYVLTRKGARFLRNEPVPHIAIIDKATSAKKYYLNEEVDTITLQQLVRSSEIPYWEGELAHLEKAAAYVEPRVIENGQLPLDIPSNN